MYKTYRHIVHRDRRRHHHMVVGFATTCTYAISAYQH
jgi:hypothetical protein